LLAYKRLQRQFPDFADAWINASILLCELGRFEEALGAAERAVELDSRNEAALLALADAHYSLQHSAEAIKQYANILLHNPEHMSAMLKISELCLSMGLYEQSLELGDMIVRREPLNSFGWYCRGVAKARMEDFASAEADLIYALELNADNLKAHICLVSVLLITGRYTEGWRHFRANRMCMPRHDFGKPYWNGEPLKDKTLLVYGHERDFSGYGDQIQFARFLPLIKSQFGCRLVYLVCGPLKRLFANLPGPDCLVADGEPLPHFDVTVPMWELFSILNIELSNIPPPVAIMPDGPPLPLPEFDRPGFRIGLVWSGITRRHLPRLFDDLSDILGIAWYGLQVPPSAEPPKLPGFIDMSQRMGDFMDTAQIAKQLDLIITVDTSMAHLAGSLGLPTIVLLPHLPEWRWGLGEHTPWYPTLTLLKQPAHNDWQGAINLLKQRIAELSSYGKNYLSHSTKEDC
jgi:Flp pilus assembly protein TadD